MTTKNRADTRELCPNGCGCRKGTDDADVQDCACDGPCCMDFEWDIRTATTEDVRDRFIAAAEDLGYDEVEAATVFDNWLAERDGEYQRELQQAIDERDRARGLAARLEAELALAEGPKLEANSRQALIACAALLDRELVFPSSPRPMEKISLRLHTIAADPVTTSMFVDGWKHPEPVSES